MVSFPGQPGQASTRKAKPFWISLKHEMMGGSGISWTICTLLQTDNHTSTSSLNFYGLDVLPAAQSTVSKN